MSRKETRGTPDTRLTRLAAQIDALAEKDEKTIEESRRIAALRCSAAAELHRACSDFVASVNALLKRTVIALDPSEYSERAFREDGPNLIQINARGRVLEVEFAATAGMLSTEDFRIPYTLEGAVRAFNQELLEKAAIEEQLLFFTVEKHRALWRFFDARTYRSGPFDREYLMTLMERLI
ncbi:MAG: hypothetical protein LAQ30_07030 [Acidobacteriia bacterium]|nr:hypothetical protein [Terriglobia bacterium]